MWSAEVRGRRVDNPALTTVWARGRLREMEDRFVIGAGDRTALEREIVAVSLRFGVLCRFTAFVAVDRSEVVNPGGQVHGIVQPVEQPSGWETETLCADALPRRKGLMLKGIPSAGAAPSAPREMRARRAPPSAECIGETDTDWDYEETYSAQELRVASAPSLIRRLLSLVFGRKGRKKAQQAAIDRALYRQRALDLLHNLQGSATADISTRLAVLGSLAAKLEELFKDLVAAGDRDPSVKALGETVLQMQTLLGQSQLVEAEVLDVWTRIENCLQRWLALGETTESPRRERFWK
jgi:hypothetical protein